MKREAASSRRCRKRPYSSPTIESEPFVRSSGLACAKCEQPGANTPDAEGDEACSEYSMFS